MLPGMTEKGETALSKPLMLIWLVLMNVWCYSALLLWTLIGIVCFSICFCVLSGDLALGGRSGCALVHLGLRPRLDGFDEPVCAF